MPCRWPGAGAGCIWSIRCRCTWTRHARRPASAPAARFTAALGDARELAEPDAFQDAVLLFGPLYHLTQAGQRRQALAQARRVLAPADASWRWRCPGAPRCWTGYMRTGWTTRASGRSWTRTWPM